MSLYVIVSLVVKLFRAWPSKHLLHPLLPLNSCYLHQIYHSQLTYTACRLNLSFVSSGARVFLAQAGPGANLADISLAVK